MLHATLNHMRWLPSAVLAVLLLTLSAGIATAGGPDGATSPDVPTGVTAPADSRPDPASEPPAPPLVAVLVLPVVLVGLAWLGYIFWIIFHEPSAATGDDPNHHDPPRPESST
jgi:hypothetical protein